MSRRPTRISEEEAARFRAEWEADPQMRPPAPQLPIVVTESGILDVLQTHLGGMTIRELAQWIAKLSADAYKRGREDGLWAA